MSVLIGNAVCDEHGKARGGEPGNQTGRELRIQPWYKNTKGWRVFRPLSKETADLLAYDMRAACENMKIGYNQSKRNTLYPLAEKVNFDCAAVSTPCECDCSSLVRVCLAYAGIRTANFNTVSEPSRLLATGKFEELTDRAYTDSPDRLRAGDILITATKGHTAVVLTDGPKADESEPTPEPEPVQEYGTVKVLGGSVNVRTKDSKAGKIMFTAHKGDTFPLLSISQNTGWYEVETKKGSGYISNRADLTKVVER